MGDGIEISAILATNDNRKNRVPSKASLLKTERIGESTRGSSHAIELGMAKSRDLRVRSFEFTVDIVRMCWAELPSEPVLRRLAFQLVDAAGSVGANLEESGAGQSKPDFIAKQSIALKEARESRFWLRVIAAAYPNTAKALEPRLQESNELIAMITASIKTAKSNPNRG